MLGWSSIDGPVWEVRRYGFAGRSMSMGAGFESLKDLCHFEFTLCFLFVGQDVGFQLLLQQPCLPAAILPCVMVMTHHSGTVIPIIIPSFCKLPW